MLVVTGRYWSLLVVTDRYWSLLIVTDRYWSLLIVTDRCWSLLVVYFTSQRAVAVSPKGDQVAIGLGEKVCVLQGEEEEEEKT